MCLIIRLNRHKFVLVHKTVLCRLRFTSLHFPWVNFTLIQNHVHTWEKLTSDFDLKQQLFLCCHTKWEKSHLEIDLIRSLVRNVLSKKIILVDPVPPHISTTPGHATIIGRCCKSHHTSHFNKVHVDGFIADGRRNQYLPFCDDSHTLAHKIWVPRSNPTPNTPSEAATNRTIIPNTERWDFRGPLRDWVCSALARRVNIFYDGSRVVCRACEDWRACAVRANPHLLASWRWCSDTAQFI